MEREREWDRQGELLNIVKRSIHPGIFVVTIKLKKMMLENQKDDVPESHVIL